MARTSCRSDVGLLPCDHFRIVGPGQEAESIRATIAHVGTELRIRVYCSRCGAMITDEMSLAVDEAPYQVWASGDLAVAAKRRPAPSDRSETIVRPAATD